MSDFCRSQMELSDTTFVCGKPDVWHLDHTYEIVHADGSRVLITWWEAPSRKVVGREEALIGQALSLIEQRLREGTLSTEDAARFFRMGKNEEGG